MALVNYYFYCRPWGFSCAKIKKNDLLPAFYKKKKKKISSKFEICIIAFISVFFFFFISLVDSQMLGHI